jgi:hypothetical protein
MWGGGVVGCSDLDDAWWIERDLGRSFQVYLCIFVQENSQWIIRNPLGTATLGRVAVRLVTFFDFWIHAEITAWCTHL